MTVLADRKKVEQAIDRFGAVITVSDARDAGVSAACLRRAELAGALKRVSKSAFVLPEVWDAATDWGRFRLSSIGFGLGAADHVFLTGPSAQALLVLPTLLPPPHLPIAIRTKPASSGTNMSSHARVRTGFLPPIHQWTRDRVRIVSDTYAAIDIARHSVPAEALAVVDHVMRGGVSREQLARVLDDLPHYPGIEQAAWAVEHGDERAESLLESLGRLAFLEAGLPAPLSNVWISEGSVTYRADHYLPEHGVIVEGDGGLKLNNRADAHREIQKQITRESWLRSRGFAVERYDYPMAMNRRGQIVSLAQRAARAQLGRPLPTCWSLDPPPHIRYG
ncbi:MAG: hypothetical protein M3Y77_17975 [Actinomycetota bacterium]|nr:hypothetical protein [Actinomycetota bacterium]